MSISRFPRQKYHNQILRSTKVLKRNKIKVNYARDSIQLKATEKASLGQSSEFLKACVNNVNCILFFPQYTVLCEFQIINVQKIQIISNILKHIFLSVRKFDASMLICFSLETGTITYFLKQVPESNKCNIFFILI